ncbi:hypothetical protein [Achromobacter phage Motura]|uniref:Uncharacterized protein n=1 Tax=Achromobacter phage Motura TaxID=2591403 RepID=A0A514CSD2_9CAUD|nr:hypothetical protein H1O15_gp074 [Achromobacter phage Motura]QDH83389.1 hypothetical protein [Achromobacter phage Motura]
MTEIKINASIERLKRIIDCEPEIRRRLIASEKDNAACSGVPYTEPEALSLEYVVDFLLSIGISQIEYAGLQRQLGK